MMPHSAGPDISVNPRELCDFSRARRILGSPWAKRE
jgi:hypothetical protein